MAVNPIRKAEKFCWLCYSESVHRFARTLPRPLRAAVLAEAETHRGDGGLVPTQWEHELHSRKPESGPGEAPEAAGSPGWNSMLAEQLVTDDQEAAS